LLDVLQLINQRILWRAPWAGVPLNCALVDHDGEGETGMFFGFGHDQFGGVINAVVGTVPIDDDSIDSPADHVFDLALHLSGIVRVVAHIHVVGATEPQHQVSVDFGVCSRVEQ
jgi:hypothetical protein